MECWILLKRRDISLVGVDIVATPLNVLSLFFLNFADGEHNGELLSSTGTVAANTGFSNADSGLTTETCISS